MKKICLMVIMIAIGFSLWADETDILKYINALKVHEIVWMTRTTDDGQVVKAETTNDLPDLFFGRYTNTEAIKSWRQAEMEFNSDGTGWFKVERGGFDTELDANGNSIKKYFKWGVILNEDRTIHVIDNSNNPRVLNKNEIMCIFQMDDGQAAVWHIMIWDGLPNIGRVYVRK